MSATPIYSAKLASTVAEGLRLIEGQAFRFSLQQVLKLQKLGVATATSYDSMEYGSTPTITTYTEFKTYSASDLPAGLSCSGDGTIHGTPTTIGDFVALVKVTSSLRVLNTEPDPNTDTYTAQGSCYVGVPLLVEAAPSSGTAGESDAKMVFANQSMPAGVAVNLHLQTTGTYSELWQVSGLPAGLTLNGAYITGTPATAGTYTVSVMLTYSTGAESGFVTESRNFTFDVTVGVPVIQTALLNGSWIGGAYYHPVDMEVGQGVFIQLSASGDPSAWTASGLPPGLAMDDGLISGTPTTAGKFSAFVVAENSEGRSVPLALLATVAEPSFPKILPEAGIDLFFDMQSRSLTLNAPKAERVLQPGETVVGGTQDVKLVIKNGETLRINLRFIKGDQVIDPDATGIRFGVASRAGAPLLLDCSTFTKEGTGSMTRHLMYVAVSSDEFTSLLDAYFDDEAVETAESTGDEARTIDAMCEVELVTGSGATLARLRSNPLDASILRSIF